MSAPRTVSVFRNVILVLAGAAVFVPLTAMSHPHEGTFVGPADGVRIVLQLQPIHPFLAEYRKTLVVSSTGGSHTSRELFSDTGGYLRTQLYLALDHSYYLKGYFDVAHVSSDAAHITIDVTAVAVGARYLGAFDEDATRTFRFISARESPEQPLVPSGG